MDNYKYGIFIAPAEFNFKSFDPDRPEGSTFDGYASIFTVPDRTQEIIQPYAMKNYFDKAMKRGMKVLYQHQKLIPIGHVKKASVDTKGLMIDEGHIDHTTYGKDTAIMMNSGTIDELSIGYLEIEADSKKYASKGIRSLEKVDPWEVSPVTWGAHQEAKVGSIKALLLQAGNSEGPDTYKAMCDLYSAINRMPSAIDYILNPDEWKETATAIIVRARNSFSETADDLTKLLVAMGVPEAEVIVNTDEILGADDVVSDNPFLINVDDDTAQAVERLSTLVGSYPNRLTGYSSW